MCLGQGLATYEGVSALVAIVKNFDLSFAGDYLKTTQMTAGVIPNPEPTPMYLQSLTLPMRDPLRVIVRARKSA